LLSAWWRSGEPWAEGWLLRTSRSARALAAGRARLLTAAAVPALMLFWPWAAGQPLQPLAAHTAAAARAEPAAAPPPASQTPAERVSPDQRAQLAAQHGAIAAADRAPLLQSYTVQPGDSLTSIAAAFGTDVASLEALNSLNGASVLQAGQSLTVLRQIGYLYTVQSGDSVDGIASSNGVTAAALIAANQLTGENPLLEPGEKLIIPKEPTVAQPSPAAGGGGGGAGAGLIWPVHGPITSPFGYRSDPWTDSGSEFHNGIDIGVPMRTPVAAACSGRVILASWDGGYGMAVEIACDDGLITMYAHNSRWNVSYGQTVAQGQIISFSGMTGNATGPHVHFGVESGGVWQNPLHYLP
jgi:murein DD-endopeptidase MepM/ murein hydrolase activator NlpD